MQRIKLGKSDLEVPVICLGGNVYGWTLRKPILFGNWTRPWRPG